MSPKLITYVLGAITSSSWWALAMFGQAWIGLICAIFSGLSGVLIVIDTLDMYEKTYKK